MTVPTSDPRFAEANSCWCNWKTERRSSFSPDYYHCERCGSHYSHVRLRSEAYQDFYSYQNYWQDRQRAKEHPVLEERPAVLQSGGRIDKWLAVLSRQAGLDRGLAIEIGCAEGTFLQALAAIGWDVLGVEPDPETARRAKESTRLNVQSGIFPDVELPECQLLVACDVMEHVADPVGFIQGAASSLADGGVLFLQQPILENEAGFGDMDPRVFDPEEHAFIFTRSSIAALLHANGFDVLENDDAWNPAHEIVVAQKRSASEAKGLKLLANLEETFSARYAQFVDELNQFGAPFGLRSFCNWSKIWEYPHLWFNGLVGMELQGKRVIDVGSERSPWPWYLARLGAEVTIVEASNEWVSHWEKVRDALQVNVDWIIAEGCELPVPDKSIDCVTSFSVIEHQSDKNKAIDEVLRVLKPGGLFGLSFDLIEEGYGMSYPEWGGSAWSLDDFESSLLKRADLKLLSPIEINRADIPDFLDWHRTTAPHHNYTCAAVLFRKK